MNELMLYDHKGNAIEHRATSSLENPANWLIEALGGVESSAGVRVSPQTMMGFIAYFACIRNISDDIGKLPIDIIERSKGKREDRNEDPLWWLLNVAPNDEMTAQDFRRTLTAHALGFQGGFAEIVRHPRTGEPLELWPLDPTCMQIERNGMDPDLFYEGAGTGDLIYRYYCGERQVLFNQDSILHIKGLSLNGIAATEITNLAKDALGAALATQNQNATFFKNGAQASGVIEIPTTLSDAALRHLRESFAARHQGSDNAHKPIILEQDASWKQMSTDPEKAQMLETMEFHVVNVARLFRMPPHKIQSLANATFSNIESQAREYVGDTLEPHAIQWEQSGKRSLLPQSSKRMYFLKHDFTALLRAEAENRANFYGSGIRAGWLSINEVREREDMNAVEGGDVHFQEVNLAPLGTVDPMNEEEDPEPEPVAAEPEPDPEPDDMDERAVRMLALHLAPAYKVIAERTAKGKGMRTEEGRKAAHDAVKARVQDFARVWCPENESRVDGIADKLSRSNANDFERMGDDMDPYWRGEAAKDTAVVVMDLLKGKNNE